MTYKSDLDKVLFESTVGEDLKVSVYSYNGGESKLQIGPRTYTKKNGDVGFRKAGRLTASEVEGLVRVLGEVQALLNKVE